MATRNVLVAESQSELVNRLVTSGRFHNASEALHAGLRLLEREEAEVATVRERLELGHKQSLAGDLAPGTGAEAVRRAFSRSSSDR